MQPYISVRRTWADEDVALLTFEVCDGRSIVSTDAYASLTWGAETTAALHVFSRQVHGGLFNLRVGEGGPEYASGAFHARLHFASPHALMISTYQQGEYVDFKRAEVAPEARLYLRTEPALLDRFIAALPELDARTDAAVILECVDLHRRLSKRDDG